MRKGVKDGLITPVFCGSAVNQQALDMLLFNMHKLLPSPQHDASHPGRGCQRRAGGAALHRG